MFKKPNKSTFTLSFDSCTNYKKITNSALDFQVDIGSAQSFNRPKYSIVVDKTAARVAVSNKANEIAFFNTTDVRKYLEETDGTPYLRVFKNIDYAASDLLNQYRDSKLFYEVDVGDFFKLLFYLILI